LFWGMGRIYLKLLCGAIAWRLRRHPAIARLLLAIADFVRDAIIRNNKIRT
jgi:hypothetical protein